MSKPIERTIEALEEAVQGHRRGGLMMSSGFLYRRIEDALAALREIEDPGYCGKAYGFSGMLGDPTYICDRPRGHTGRHYGHECQDGEILVRAPQAEP